VAYELHVVRTARWQDAAESPITRDEVNALIDSDPELEWSPSGEGGEGNRNQLIGWRGASMRWERDQMVCADPGAALIAKLIRIAQVLKANVIGDNGEKYVLRRNMWGPERIHTVKP